MKIVVDIQHPAHVHYFKNFIWDMERKGHDILITASEKDISRQLLDSYGFSYVIIGNYGKGILRKIINLPLLDFRMWKSVRKFNPDLFIGFSPIRASHVSFVLRKRIIAIDDTEHAVFEHILYRPFTNIILTPDSFQKNFGKKQIRFKGTTDLFYLHPNRFTPNPKVLEELGLTEMDTFFIVRFVSWDANHDIGQTGIADREGFVHEMAKYGRVFITSENELPESLKKYQITISPEKIHDLMYYATLFVGESGTMATEAACLGTYSVLMDPESIQKDGSCTFGVIKYFSDLKILYVYNNEIEVLKQARTLLRNPNLKYDGKKIRKKIVTENSDVTEDVISLVESLQEGEILNV